MIIKLHSLGSYVDSDSEELAERFHYDLKFMKTRYQGRWSVNVMADDF